MTTPKPDLFLITGIPGTGKTTFGNKFASEFDFVHHDLEDGQTINRLASNSLQFIAEIVAQNKNVVVTWGFGPDDEPSIQLVRQFRNAGLKLIWFDGNRPAALREFQKRRTVTEEAFYLQMYRIEHSGVVARLRPVIINSFDPNGQFKSTGELLAEIRRA